MAEQRGRIRAYGGAIDSLRADPMRAGRLGIATAARKLLGFLVAVCASCGAASDGQAQHVRVFDFESYAENTLPDNFQQGMTGTWKATEWSIRTVAGNRVLAHVGYWNEDPDGVFPVCWVKNAVARDLTLGVRLFPTTPPAEIQSAVHDGAGIVLRLKDADNYYLLRAVPHETRVRLYKVVNGKRHTLTGKSLKVTTGTWHELKLRATGSRFVAYYDGEELFRYNDATFAEAGAFGIWSKPNNVTYFDDLKAEILD